MAERGRREVPGFLTSGESSGVGSPVRDGSLGGEESMRDGDMVKKERKDDGPEENSHTPNPKTQDAVSRHIRLPSVAYSSSQSIPPVKIAEHTNAHIILPPSARHATTAASLANLRRCVVDLSSPSHSTTTTTTTTATRECGQPFASLTMKGLRDCLILGGRVAGPVHATDLRNCILVFEEARQFRLHGSKDCQVYLRVSSRPVIEECQGIAFAPFSDEDEGSEKGLWQQVDDFQWLRSGEKSPNWRILPEGERIRQETWDDVGRGVLRRGVEEILGSMGVGKA